MVSYNPARAAWAIDVQETCAIPIYQNIWPGCTIIEIDKLGMEGDTTARQFDFSGLDKVIQLANRTTIHIAQRFRKPSGKNIDFSLRYKTPGPNGQEQNAEYFILGDAFHNGQYYPNKYAFGITNSEDPGSGFQVFRIYNLRRLLQAITQNSVKSIGIWPNGDGSSGIYYRLKALRRFEEYDHLRAGQVSLGWFA